MATKMFQSAKAGASSLMYSAPGPFPRDARSYRHPKAEAKMSTVNECQSNTLSCVSTRADKVQARCKLAAIK